MFDPKEEYNGYIDIHSKDIKLYLGKKSIYLTSIVKLDIFDNAGNSDSTETTTY